MRRRLEDVVFADEVGRLLRIVARPPGLDPVLHLEAGGVGAAQLPCDGQVGSVADLDAHHAGPATERVGAEV